MHRIIKRTPPRLDVVFQRFNPAIYFITFNTHGRRSILADDSVHDRFRAYCKRASKFHVDVGRYVIMPDHVHLFLAVDQRCTTSLSSWIKGLKRELDLLLRAERIEPARLLNQKLCSFWQPGFFDHQLRSDESYSEKWDYVVQNPVRAGLVRRAEEWPYAGEITKIHPN